MSSRSLNKVTLIGNLTRDPELRFTPNGTAVCSFGLATNRYWTTESGEKKEEVEFHRIVSWNKLAELCSQLLTKGRKVYVEGRLQTRSWQTQDGQQRQTTEIVIDDMIILDPKRVDQGMNSAVRPVAVGQTGVTPSVAVQQPAAVVTAPTDQPVSDQTSPSNQPADDKQPEAEEKQEKAKEDINPDDIPF